MVPLYNFSYIDPPRAPTLRVRQCTNTTLTLEWDEPENGGMPITQYTIIPNPAVPPCGNYCHVDASVRQFHFGPLNHSQTYDFAVHADNCGGTQEGRPSKLTVFFGGTACEISTDTISSAQCLKFPINITSPVAVQLLSLNFSRGREFTNQEFSCIQNACPSD